MILIVYITFAKLKGSFITIATYIFYDTLAFPLAPWPDLVFLWKVGGAVNKLNYDYGSVFFLVYYLGFLSAAEGGFGIYLGAYGSYPSNIHDFVSGS